MSCYANARNLLTKSADDLRAIRQAGLELLYLGLESGDDDTLAAIHKGVTVAEQIEGCARATAAGFDLSVTAILGLAGAERSAVHARGHRRRPVGHRPAVHRRAQPHGRPGHRTEARVRSGDFVVPDALAMLRELREMIAATDVSRRPVSLQPRLELPAGRRPPAARQADHAHGARHGAGHARARAA